MDKINLKKIKFKMLKKYYEWGNFNGSAGVHQYLSLTSNLLLKITDFINLILDIIISCFHNKTRLDNLSSFVSFEKSR